jgi:hypothetical protein
VCENSEAFSRAGLGVQIVAQLLVLVLRRASRMHSPNHPPLFPRRKISSPTEKHPISYLVVIREVQEHVMRLLPFWLQWAEANALTEMIHFEWPAKDLAAWHWRLQDALSAS